MADGLVLEKAIYKVPMFMTSPVNIQVVLLLLNPSGDKICDADKRIPLLVHMLPPYVVLVISYLLDLNLTILFSVPVPANSSIPRHSNCDYNIINHRWRRRT